MTIDLHEVSHRYQDVDALRDVQLKVGPGITALLGVNGAGKSTLLRIAAGILAPTRGRVLVGDRDLWGRSSRSGALRAVNLMPQGAAFPARMTALEIVTYLTWLKGWSGAEARRRSRAALGDVGLGDRIDTKFGALSGGMARRVAFAQAIATEPEVLLLDEPTTGLDPAQRRSMVDLVAGLGDSGVTVVLSSHVVEDVEDLAADVVVLHEGTVRYSGAVAGLAALAGPSTRRSPLESGFLNSIGHVA